MALFKSKKTTTSTKDEKTINEKTKAEPSMKDLYVESSAKSKKTKKSSGQKLNPKLNDLLIKPLVTEKATNLASEHKYVFMVANDANKISVAKAVQLVYGVKPVAVNIVKMKGKTVTRGRIKGQRKDWKKAIVTLAKGETIAIYEGV